MEFTIKDGAKLGLCGTCSHSNIFVDDRGIRTIRCGGLQYNPIFPRKIIECSLYEQINTPSIFEINKIGWVLEFDKRKQVAGFRPPKPVRNIRYGPDGEEYE